MTKLFNNRSIRIAAAIFLLIVVVLSASAGAVHAQAATSTNPQLDSAGSGHSSLIGDLVNVFGLSIWDFIFNALAIVAYAIQTVMSFVLALSGLFLNYSMTLTLHIKEFVNATPAVYATWRAIRDISGLFIIFFLLYAAIQLILGLENPKFGGLIKNIVIAGVLINFSFFFAGLGIDASNVVSVQLYNAIAPANSIAVSSGDASELNPYNVQSHIGDGGISSIFMSSLGVTKLFDTMHMSQQANAAQTTGKWSDPVNILVLEVVGIMIMLTAAISFTVAAAAFVIRFILLIVLLAFSPIWFISFISPQVADYAKTWTNTYKSMLLFMPVYLLLMYMALSVLSQGGPLSSLQNAQKLASLNGAPWYASFLAVGINSAIVIFLLNLPLVAAVAIGGKATSFIKADKLGAGAMWKRLGNRSWSTTRQTAQGAWRNTGGRVASRVARSDAFQTFAGKSIIGQAALKTTRTVSREFDTKLEARTKKREDFAKSLNRAGATAYADRLFSSKLNATINNLSMAGTIGRANRVAAANILTARSDEIKTELDKKSSELRKHQAAATAAGGVGNLSQYEKDRIDKLSGTNTNGNNPGLTNEIADSQRDLNNIQGQANNFQASTGTSIKDTGKRKY
ncbi:MAG: hypothetical protein KGI49_01375 [Patescibacteria group bacterium]|nr:hypothetical protein [Patescibacteria group bacterium]